MTCKEVRAHFQEEQLSAVMPGHESGAMLEHIARCGECRRFVEEQEDLAKCFPLLREGCPPVPASLDAAVLTRYRSYISERPGLSNGFTSTRWIGTMGGLRWAAAIAFALIAAGSVLLLISGERRGVDQISTDRPRLMFAPEAAKAISRTAEPGSVPKKPNSIAKSAKHATPATLVARSESWSSTDFQGLMYCDQLSCPEVMDVIRVQLPSAALGFGPTSSNASDFVYADVLVGPDGIARGIRVVE